MKRHFRLMMLFILVLFSGILISCGNSVKTYTITFHTDGGSYVEEISYKHKEQVTLPNPTKEGYTFKGWFIDENHQTSIDGIDYQSSYTFYAKWDINTYSIDYQNLEGTTHNNPLTYTVEDEITLNNPSEREHFVFVGWFTSLEDGKQVRKIRKGSLDDITLYALWYDNRPPVVDPVTDEIGPEIHGVKPIVYMIGNPIPNLLEGITATDNITPSDKIIIEVDDLSVNYNIPGTYSIIYYAMDASDNVTSVKTTITVEVEDIEDIFKEVTETFDGHTSSSSSYLDDTFTGVNGIVWTYVGMRSDLSIDGKALTFGASSNHHLKATLPNGISSLALDAKHAYSGSDVRTLGIYVNNMHVGSIDVDTNTAKTYKIEFDSYSGPVELRIQNTTGERITIDNVTWTEGNNKQDLIAVTKDYNWLNIDTLYIENQSIKLPEVGPNGSTISWGFVNESDPNNRLIDLVNKQVVMPEEKQVEVSIKATITSNDESKVKTFRIKLGEGDPVSISIAKSTIGLVKTQGVITGFIKESTHIRAFLQDNTDAIQLLLPLSITPDINKEVIIKGSVVNGIIEDAIIIETLGDLVINETLIKEPVLTSNHNKLVRFTGLISKDYQEGLATLIHTSGTFKVDLKDSTGNPFIGAKLGQEISVLGHLVVQGNEISIWVLDKDNIQVDVVNEALLETLLKEDVSYPETLTITNSIRLDTKAEQFDIDILWSSSHPEILSNTGVVTNPEEDTLITLSYTYVKDSVIYLSGDIFITVKKKMPLLAYYQEAEGLMGHALKDQLTIIISRNNNLIGYSSTSNILSNADQQSDRPNQVYLIYDSRYVSSTWDGGATWNKEHIWPQSKLNGASVSDMHNLRACDPIINSRRGNNPFRDGSGSHGSVSGGYYPGDEHKGDVARAILYMSVRWKSELGNKVTASIIGDLSMFIRWHYEDPVDDFERSRHEVIFATQRNRNPFIDHPELVDLIWGITAHTETSEDVFMIVEVDFVYKMEVDLEVLDNREFFL